MNFWYTDLTEDSGQPWFSTHAEYRRWYANRTTSSLRFWKIILLAKLALVLLSALNPFVFWKDVRFGQAQAFAFFWIGINGYHAGLILPPALWPRTSHARGPRWFKCLWPFFHLLYLDFGCRKDGEYVLRLTKALRLSNREGAY